MSTSAVLIAHLREKCAKQQKRIEELEARPLALSDQVRDQLVRAAAAYRSVAHVQRSGGNIRLADEAEDTAAALEAAANTQFRMELYESMAERLMSGDKGCIEEAMEIALELQSD